jgi:hypothetical protein
MNVSYKIYDDLTMDVAAMTTSPTPIGSTVPAMEEFASASSLLRMQFPFKVSFVECLREWNTNANQAHSHFHDKTSNSQLHSILNDAPKKGFDDIIAWSPHGCSFRVFSKERFEQEVMNRYFDSNKYKTFQRNLNLWGYQVGENKEIVHKYFVRGKLDLCEKMHRVKIKGAYIRGTRSAKATIHEPSPVIERPGYYAMDFLEAGIRARMSVSPQFPSLSALQPPRYHESASLLSLLNTTVPDVNVRHAIAGSVQRHQQDVETRASALMALLVSEERNNRQLAASFLSQQHSRGFEPVAQVLYTSMDVSQSTFPSHISFLEAARMKSMSQLQPQRAAATTTHDYNLNLLEALLTSASRA